MPFFTPGHVAALKIKVDDKVKALLDVALAALDGKAERMAASAKLPEGQIDLVEYLSAELPLFTLSEILGVPEDYRIGIVPASDPGRNIAVFEERLGQAHSRSPEFLDVQTFVNRRCGVPMILHGAQETYSDEHGDEKIDIFFAEVDAVSGQADPDEDERVELVLTTRDEIVGKIKRDEIHDSKTLAAWLMFEKMEGESPKSKV